MRSSRQILTCIVPSWRGTHVRWTNRAFKKENNFKFRSEQWSSVIDGTVTTWHFRILQRYTIILDKSGWVMKESRKFGTMKMNQVPGRSLDIYKCPLIRQRLPKKQCSGGIPYPYDAAELSNNFPTVTDRKWALCCSGSSSYRKRGIGW